MTFSIVMLSTVVICCYSRFKCKGLQQKYSFTKFIIISMHIIDQSSIASLFIWWASIVESFKRRTRCLETRESSRGLSCDRPWSSSALVSGQSSRPSAAVAVSSKKHKCLAIQSKWVLRKVKFNLYDTEKWRSWAGYFVQQLRNLYLFISGSFGIIKRSGRRSQSWSVSKFFLLEFYCDHFKLF